MFAIAAARSKILLGAKYRKIDVKEKGGRTF